ncbi:MAG: hypothetical protein AAF799_27330 [Myxococcota bacterium]
MSVLEKTAWIFSACLTISYLTYIIVVFVRAGDAPLAETAYVGPLVTSFVASVVLTVVGAVIASMANPREADRTDERDEVISRHGDAIALWVLSLGVLGPLVLAMIEVAHFWIANALYLNLVVASVVGTVAKLVAYRRGVAPW